MFVACDKIHAKPSTAFTAPRIAPTTTPPTMMPMVCRTGISTGSSRFHSCTSRFHKPCSAPHTAPVIVWPRLFSVVAKVVTVFHRLVKVPLRESTMIPRIHSIALPTVVKASAIICALSAPNSAVNPPIPASSPWKAANSSPMDTFTFWKATPMRSAKSTIAWALSAPKIAMRPPKPASPPWKASVISPHAAFKLLNKVNTGCRACPMNAVNSPQICFPASVFVKNKTRAPTTAAMPATIKPIGLISMAVFNPSCAAVADKVPARCAASRAGRTFICAANELIADTANKPACAARKAAMPATTPPTAPPITTSKSLLRPSHSATAGS